MRPSTSLFLDAVRLAAALTVLLGHLSGARLTGGLFWQIGPFMEDAVTVFFVLSGFVIAYATDNPRQTAKTFAIARVARVASVAVPALLLTFTLDTVGASLRQDLYTPAWGYVSDARGWQIFSSLLFLNHIWFWDTGTGSNLPYWSLSYECWYYVLFGLAVFAPERFRLIAIAGVLALVGPRIAAAFPLWLMGVLSFRICRQQRVTRGWGLILCLLTFLAYASYVSWGKDEFGQLSFLTLGPGNLLRGYVVGLLFAVHLIGVDAALAGHLIYAPVARVIRWLAGATFSIYLFHMPIGQFITTIMPGPPASIAARISMLGGTLIAVFMLAEVTERRKEAWRCYVSWVVNCGSRLPLARLP